MKARKKIVVIGGGFAGLNFVRNIDTELFDVCLIDKLNHHQFQPLFYQVATSQLEPSSISFPFRKVFQDKKNLQIRMADAQQIDAAEKKVVTDIGSFDYDYLVLAGGCSTNFFGNEEIRKNALTLKSTTDSIDVRNHILTTFENVISCSDEQREALLHIFIAGAGPTGVEMAGAIAEIKQNILPKDFPGIDFSKLKITVVEGSPNTLNSMSPKAQKASRKYLLSMGVEVLTEVYVKSYDGETVSLSNGSSFPTKTLIWAAGVTGNLIPGLSPELVQRGNRLKVNRINQLEGSDSIFVIGDLAYMETPKYPNAHPQVANVAINQAKRLAVNLRKMEKKRRTREFEYRDLGSMATVGKHKAVVDFPFMKLKGYLAWFIWMFLHLMLILSVKNKLIIFINWAYAYFSNDSSLRLIFGRVNRK